MRENTHTNNVRKAAHVEVDLIFDALDVPLRDKTFSDIATIYDLRDFLAVFFDELTYDSPESRTTI